MAINLSEYEDVNSRIKRFRGQFTEGRICVSIVDRGTDANGEWVLMEASVYISHDQLAPSATDYAFGHTAFYRPNMKRWYVEDTSTSAVGRALGLLIPSDHRPTRENMEQAVDQPAIARTSAGESVPHGDLWDTPSPAQNYKDEAMKMAREALAGAGIAIADVKTCQHGPRVYKSGVTKTGAKWEAYFCGLHSDIAGERCPTIGADGREWKRK